MTTPSAAEFSTDPDSNTSIGGKDVAENCDPGNLNDVARYLAAALRALYDQVQTLTDAMPKSGGTFTGDISRQGQGAYMVFADASQTSGKVYKLPEGSDTPTLAEGESVLFYQ
jgi:hypothetical protein